MAWKKIDPKTGKETYIKKQGSNYQLTLNKKSNTVEQVPEGFEITTREDGSLKLQAKK